MSTAEPTDAVVIDPRIRERRLAVQRDAGRRRMVRAMIASGCVMAIVLVFAVVHSPLLDVDSITVDGATQTGAEAVRKASGISDSDPVLRIDGGAVERRVEALPWVAEATVHRRLPSTIDIDVRERRAVAVLTRGATHVLVDSSGRALATVASRPLDLVAVEGLRVIPKPGGRASRAALDAVDVATRLARELPGTVRAVIAGEPLTLALVDGGVAVLGTTDDLDAKLLAVEAMLSNVDRTCLERLDVRAPGTPVLTRRSACG